MLESLYENFRKPKQGLAGKMLCKSMNKGHKEFADWARSFLSISSSDKILDLGCGGGQNLKDFLTQANEVWGLDHSKTSLEISQQTNKDAISAGRCHLVEADVTNLPFDDESFDIVSAFETTYFWPDLTQSFKEIYRVLKPGGHVLIANELSNPEDPETKKWSERIKFPVYTADEYTQMLSDAGFSVEKHLGEKDRFALVGTKR